MQTDWILKTFDALTPYELYAILRLRVEVFVVEQNCVFQDIDNKDQDALHLMGWENNELLAYSRLVPPADSNEMPSIGRVVVSSIARGSGLGKLLMEQSILEVRRLYGDLPIQIGAQYHLTKFYIDLGFEIKGAPYLDDGIDHIKMILPVQSA